MVAEVSFAGSKGARWTVCSTSLSSGTGPLCYINYRHMGWKIKGHLILSEKHGRDDVISLLPFPPKPAIMTLPRFSNHN